MSDQKRSIDEIHKEYSQLCSQAGHLQYQISVMGKDLVLINEQLKSLNFEAAKVSAEEKAASEPKAE